MSAPRRRRCHSEATVMNPTQGAAPVPINAGVLAIHDKH